ncbi:Uncharacterised protein [Vibrio cholerae]|uniref:Uncharacterized protein n=1 Tax=Vibrio cholerae TaxID=666 RepID=A0A655W6H2_VIBCL|nr:Uncharacterised protein [Vibrio cholerae]
MLARFDVVRHSTDRQCFRAVFRRYTVNACRFHFYANDAVFIHHIEHGRIWRVEQFCREQVANFHVNATCFGGFFCSFYHLVVRNRSKIMIFEANTVDFRVSTRAHADHHITHFDAFVHCTTATDADDLFHAVIFDKLGHVD